MFFLGIDLGATFIKGAILDTEAGILRGEEILPFPPFMQSRDSWRREVEPLEVIRNIQKIIFLLLSKEPMCEGGFFYGANAWRDFM